MPFPYRYNYWPTRWERFLWWAFGIHWSRKWPNPPVTNGVRDAG